MRIPKANEFNLKSKIWLEIHGRPIMGEGRMAMLEAIDANRSILEASRSTGISYRRMRGAIRDMETAIEQVLVITRRGGRQGGYAELTPAALALMEAFRTLTHGFQDASDLRFKRIFGFF